MVGKFFILAFLCVSLAQVQGVSLESAVKSALGRLKNIDANAEKETNYAIKEVQTKQELVGTKTAIFLEKETAIETQNEQSLERTAQLYEKKATESNKPPETIQCIRSAKAKAVAQIEATGPIFEVDIRRLEKIKLSLMEISAKPLEGLQSSLPERYEKAVDAVQSCKDVVSVRKSMERTSRDYNLLFAELKRIRNQVNQHFSQFNKEASLMLSNHSRKVNRIQAEGAREIKNCFYRKNLLEEY